MKTKVFLVALTFLLIGCGQPAASPTPEQVASPGVYPGQEWQEATRPEQLGWSPEGLAAAQAYAEEIGSAAVMIVDDGLVVAAWGDITRNFMAHSMRKSLMSALYGIYVGEGRIETARTLEELGIDDHTPLTETEKQATIADLLKARSGVYIPAVGESAGMKFLRPERGSHLPGTFWYYNNWDFNALGTIFDQETGEENIYQAFKTRIADPIGMQDFVADQHYVYEPYSAHPYYGFVISARDMARFGLLFARGGRWEDEQIIPESWVAESTTAYSDARTVNACEGGYGYMWWVAADGRHLPNVALPDGSFSARGAGGQHVLVIPAWDVVIVHRVDTFIPDNEVVDSQFGRLVRLILQAGPQGMDLGVPNVAEGIELDAAELERFVGPYKLSQGPEGVSDELPQEVSIELNDGRLQATAPGEAPLELIPIAPTRFRDASCSVDLVEFGVNGEVVESMTVKIGTVAIVFEPEK
jgi:CubicO group peptidase (beta-lactamase class C family)